ncbi:mitochondrial cardiolipin hydrolase-like [Battus philenor]|uniref:mitochondrial cardiolipin hydrolase-like n=1 Tax=Battus philenor TaxID=42288 RepID=UPI0035D01A31
MNPSSWKSVLGKTGSAMLKNIIDILSFNKKKNIAQCETINEVLFYGAEDDKEKEEIGLNNLCCIYYVIVHACQSIDVCLPSLTSETICKCFIAVQERNCAAIRVAIYHSSSSDHLQNLVKVGIAVRIVNSLVKLEHEFILIDANDTCKEAVAVLGSLNYEVSRVNCNRDTTMLTSEPTVILALKKEFDRVWLSGEDLTQNKDENKLKINNI